MLLVNFFVYIVSSEECFLDLKGKRHILAIKANFSDQCNIIYISVQAST